MLHKEVPFLGHFVGRDGVRADPKKIAVVMGWSFPTSVKEVRSFLGFCTYYRRFVKVFTSIATLLFREQGFL